VLAVRRVLAVGGPAHDVTTPRCRAALTRPVFSGACRPRQCRAGELGTVERKAYISTAGVCRRSSVRLRSDRGTLFR
jgi:hypothetical protein